MDTSKSHVWVVWDRGIDVFVENSVDVMCVIWIKYVYIYIYTYIHTPRKCSSESGLVMTFSRTLVVSHARLANIVGIWAIWDLRNHQFSLYIPGTQMASIFEGTQPPKTRPNFQSKQGAPVGFQVYIHNMLQNMLHLCNIYPAGKVTGGE